MFLNTERLILREFLDDDWQAVLANQSDPRYFRFSPRCDRKPEDVKPPCGASCRGA